MPTKPKQYSDEFKEEVVALITEQNYSVSEAAKSLGVRNHLLYRWKQEEADNVVGQQFNPKQPNQIWAGDINQYIRYYNHRRLHSTLEYNCPVDYENSFSNVSSFSRPVQSLAGRQTPKQVYDANLTLPKVA